MTTTLYPVTARLRAFENMYAAAGDFGRGPAEPVPERRVLDEPGWAPYCVDADRHEVLFAHISPAIDLAEVPFYFVTQYREADAVIAMSFADAHELAAALPDPKLILIYSMGRCGSTLVSHALNGPGNVVSLSEPGAFEHRALRTLGQREDTRALIRDLCRLTFAIRRRRDADTLAIKFKSQALFVAEQLCNAVPEARNVFLYRDAVSWGNSFAHFLASMNVPMPTEIAGRDFHWMMVSADKPLDELARFIDLDRPPADLGAILAPGWTIHIEEYNRLWAAGLPFYALRYNELMRDRAAEIEGLFDFCCLPRDGIAKALAAFDTDSQEGTVIARSDNPRRMSPGEEATYRATLARVPALADPDLILKDVRRP